MLRLRYTWVKSDPYCVPTTKPSRQSDSTVRIYIQLIIDGEYTESGTSTYYHTIRKSTIYLRMGLYWPIDTSWGLTFEDEVRSRSIFNHWCFTVHFWMYDSSPCSSLCVLLSDHYIVCDRFRTTKSEVSNYVLRVVVQKTDKCCT